MSRQSMIVSVVVILSLLGGCESVGVSANQRQSQAVPPAENAEYLAKGAVRRDGGASQESAVESALAWSEKYLQAVEKYNKLADDNKELQRQLAERDLKISQLENQLRQSQKELTDANSLLIEMRGELNKWKSDVLGFRQEMRNAQQAQLDALAKILKLLGGEIPQQMVAVTTQTAPKRPTTRPTNE